MSDIAAPATARLPPLANWLPAALVILAVWLLGRSFSDLPGSRILELSLWLGLCFGVLLQRSRFCFYCIGRDFIESRDARGLLGIVAALAAGTLGYHLVFGAFLADPAAPRLPPGAHIGPVSWALAAGALVFGLGMSFSGSCISAQLYRFGEGVLSAPVALLGAACGFVLGFWSWNDLYLGTIQEAPAMWLPHYVGYGGSLAVQLLALAGLALILARLHRPQAHVTGTPAWWRQRWPTYVGGILVGALGTAAYLRIAPLGVTAELGSIARTAANNFNLLPVRMEGLDAMRGCATAIKESLWSNNGVFVTGLVLGSFAAAWSAGDFRLRVPDVAETLWSFFGGILMGWGAMVALGCTVGTLLSGIMAAAISGWVFALFCGAGLYLGWWIRRRAACEQ